MAKQEQESENAGSGSDVSGPEFGTVDGGDEVSGREGLTGFGMAGNFAGSSSKGGFSGSTSKDDTKGLDGGAEGEEEENNAEVEYRIALLNSHCTKEKKWMRIAAEG